MSGIEDPGTPPEIPEEYAATYRDAYLRALAQEPAQDAAQLPEEFPVVVEDDETDEARHWSSGVWMAILVVAVVLLIAAAFGLGKLLSDDESPATGSKAPAKSASTSASASGQASPTRSSRQEPTEPPTEQVSQSDLGPVWEGDVVPVTISSGSASCTARPGVDSAGKQVTYDVTNAYDADPTTAWRCEDRGVGQTLTLTLPSDTEVGEVGLIPGYAKNDPVTGTDRYAENNRITRVQWTLAGGVQVVQRLDPDPKDRQMQTIRVPRTATGSITLEILAVKRGPRNTTAISSIGIGSAA
jgi:hypothetical protein